MASTKQRAFEAFEEHGPDAYSAGEWAERLDTKKSYIYQVRGDFKDEHEESEADEAASTPEESAEPEETTNDTPDETEPEHEPHEAAQGNDDEAEPSATTTEASAPTTAAEENSERSATSPATPDADAGHEPTEAVEDPTDPEPATDGGDIVAVGHEGKEKLSPDGFEEQAVASIEAPDGVELPDDANPDDFEPDAAPSAQKNSDPKNSADPDPEPEPEQDNSGSGGLLSRIRGDSEPETTGEVVEDAPDADEADRRAEVLGAIEGASDGPTAEPEPEAEGDQPNTSTTSHGLVMDEDLVANLFGLPFNQAANATGWDGWELSKEEKEANARLIVAYCDEQDIDLSAGGMLAMSLMSTIGGRAAGYARHRKHEQAEAEAEPDAASADPDPDEQAAEAEPVERQTSRSTSTEQTTDAAADGDDFDFGDSETWD